MRFGLDTSSKTVPGTSHPYEDRVLLDDERGVYAVADGVTVSSQGSGGTAAELVLKLIVEDLSYGATEREFEETIERVHRKIREIRATDRRIGETTLTLACITEDRAQVVNVGDSPAYLLRGRDLRVLTRPDRNEFGYITQVIGHPEKVKAHSVEVALIKRDVLIVASDGVAHVINHTVLLPIVEAAPNSSVLAKSIVEKAAETWTGYDDDKSVVIIRVL